ncbi:RagB/SusD family nutrient uptake outer membrane protein [Parabacteroides goldsteinii]|jgi:SusD family.|uniref:RagB/SusD family nutrient uptake outer membrane protein n=1 Tax=Parabacteroides goldsteinii TaxID=328812 RepID=UPI000E7E99EE|nr:RagB/SusD family nutrient uptake outer membrane protein [Parabacteroides goldsteinii]HBA32026.1 RagB/SusD family nutrient uptake outer membrane protein [Parabacteroides goldsteinii]
MKKIFITCAAILAFFSSCSSILDKEDLSSISEEQVWVDETLTTAFLNALYVSIPSWDTTVADASDEATGGGGWIDGTTTPDNMSDTKDSAPTWYWPYKDIRNCNIFIQNAQNTDLCTIDRDLADRLTYEARFIRAYLYFEMVKRYGGVPLITVPQELTDDLFVKRTSTKDCFDFIINELKACVEGLPASFSGDNLGRVTKGAAKAFLGRVLLFRASPQFNPSNNAEHWQTAYNYNKETLDYLIGQGHALYSDYGKLFLEEMNQEVIFAIRYENPTRTHTRDAKCRPITFSMNNTGGNHPTQEVIDRFPTVDGKTYTYADWKKDGKNDIFTLWQNRDKRFYATVVYQGVTYFNTVMELNENAQNDYAYGKNMGSRTGYYSKKGIDESISISDCQKSGTDYIDIRLAEVMLNYAEAAVEVGKQGEAFEILKQIRERAGINETSSDPELKGKVYGLNPNMNQSEMREAVREERFIELLFEQKRMWDLRRWMIYDKLMIGQEKRHALVMNKQTDGTYTTYLFDRDNTPMIAKQNMYFLPIKRSELSNNPNLEQTKGWENGTFDPQAEL